MEIAEIDEKRGKNMKLLRFLSMNVFLYLLRLYHSLLRDVSGGFFPMLQKIYIWKALYRYDSYEKED